VRISIGHVQPINLNGAAKCTGDVVRLAEMPKDAFLRNMRVKKMKMIFKNKKMKISKSNAKNVSAVKV
jgi:hypothetical protein